jgi:hypothetical protein
MAVTITSAALQYQGSGYTYGGPGWPPGNWDCSSFVSEVLGRQLRLGLPGGGHWGAPGDPPNAHGPDVTAYASWGGAVAVASPSPGDLVIWDGAGPNGHIGIVLGSNEMISALNTSMGTVRTPINGYGPAGLSPVYRRVTGAPGGSEAAPGGVDVTSLWQSLFPQLSWRDVLIPAALVAGVIVAAVVVAGGLWAAGTLGLGVAASRAGQKAAAAVTATARSAG